MSEDVNVEVETEVSDSEDVVTEQVEEGAQEPETQSEDKKEEGKDDFVPFPKKAKNAISRRDREIAKLRAQLREQQQAQPQPQQKSDTVDQVPKEEDFETYGEYLEAKTLYKVQQQMAEQQQQQQEQQQQTQLTQQQQEYVAHKQQDIAQKALDYKQTIPDFSDVMDENADLLDYMPPHVEMAFYEADDAALAFYNLAKEGKIAELANMSPYRAAMEIARAQSMPQVQPVKPAPKPMQGVSGTGQSAGNFSNIAKDPDKLMDWLNS